MSDNSPMDDAIRDQAGAAPVDQMTGAIEWAITDAQRRSEPPSPDMSTKTALAACVERGWNPSDPAHHLTDIERAEVNAAIGRSSDHSVDVLDWLTAMARRPRQDERAAAENWATADFARIHSEQLMTDTDYLAWRVRTYGPSPDPQFGAKPGPAIANQDHDQQFRTALREARNDASRSSSVRFR
jgi:hypothetical protein